MSEKLASVHPEAVIGKNVSISPFVFIDKNVVIGDNCQIASHVVIRGPSFIGANNKIYQFYLKSFTCTKMFVKLYLNASYSGIFLKCLRFAKK